MIVSLVWYRRTGIAISSGIDGSRAGCDDHLVGGEFVAVIGAQHVAAVG